MPDNNTDAAAHATDAPNGGDDIPTYTVAQYIRQRWEELPEEEKQMWRDQETQGVSESDSSSPTEGLSESLFRDPPDDAEISLGVPPSSQEEAGEAWLRSELEAIRHPVRRLPEAAEPGFRELQLCPEDFSDDPVEAERIMDEFRANISAYLATRGNEDDMAALKDVNGRR